MTWTNTGSGWVVNDLVNRNVYTPWGVSCDMAVNSAGVAVGYGHRRDRSPTRATTPWSSPATAYRIMLGNLGALGAGNGVIPTDTALGINDSGVVVGTATTSSGGLDAFIYYLGGNNTMQDMNTVFASSIPAGWSLTAATAIDNNGDIVGYRDQWVVRHSGVPALAGHPRRRQPGRQGRYQRSHDRAGALQPNRHGLVPGRVHRQTARWTSTT